MNPNETVIVIRSLVPGGVAQLDGQLIPGDRLIFVNNTILENATLDQAVQSLKGAPKGTVRIGVAKPLPIPDGITQLNSTDISKINDNGKLTIVNNDKRRREYFRKRKVNITQPLHYINLIESLENQHNLVKSESF